MQNNQSSIADRVRRRNQMEREEYDANYVERERLEEQERQALEQGILQRRRNQPPAVLDDEDRPPSLYGSLLDLSYPNRRELSRKLFEKGPPPKKELQSHYQVFEPEFVWQVDLKFVPPNANKELNYIMVGVDLSTRLCDAVPLAGRTMEDAATAGINRLLVRNKINPDGKLPKLIVTDSGSEFGRQFTELLNSLGIKHRKTQPGRKQQTAIVEYINGLIGYALNTHAYLKRTTPKDRTPKTMTQIDYFGDNILNRTVDRINDYMRRFYPKPAKLWFDFADTLPPNDLRVGDAVYAKNVQADKLRYRHGQHRFLSTPFVVTQVFPPVLKNQPWRYMTSYSSKMTFNRSELIKIADYDENTTQVEFG